MKVWGYVAAGAIGIALGILIAVKWVVKETAKVEYTIKKIKNKRIQGDVTVTASSPDILIKQIEALQKQLLKLKKDGT